MSNQYISVLCLVLIGLSLSGCVITGPPPAITFSGELETAGNQLQMDGSIGDTTGTGPDTYENVTIYFYSDQKKLIQLERVGDLTGRKEVSVAVKPVPKYIVIDSEDFWEVKRISVMYMQRMENGNYSQSGQATSRDELPVVPKAE